jgi:hypothetical protein
MTRLVSVTKWKFATLTKKWGGNKDVQYRILESISDE